MNYLKIGFIRKPHGFKGQFKVTPLTDSISRYKKIKNIYILINDDYIKAEIESAILSNEVVILKLKGYNSIEQIEKFRSCYIYIDREAGAELNNDEFYSQDLLGCSVYYQEKKVGKVINLQNYGSCDIFIIECTDNKEINYPFIKSYIDMIDIVNKKIVINQYEGFFD